MNHEEIEELTAKFYKTWLHDEEPYILATRITDELIEYCLDGFSFHESCDVLYYSLLLRRCMRVKNFDIGGRMSILRTKDEYLNIAHEISSYANKAYVRGQLENKTALIHAVNVVIKNLSAMVSGEAVWKVVERKIHERYTYAQRKAMGVI
jgi:hypothetical protein